MTATVPMLRDDEDATTMTVHKWLSRIALNNEGPGQEEAVLFIANGIVESWEIPDGFPMTREDIAEVVTSQILKDVGENREAMLWAINNGW